MTTVDPALALSAPVSPAHFAVRATGHLSGSARWLPAKHLLFINRLITEIAFSETSRFLCVSLPPRHGKTELLSRWFPAWYLGMFPDRRVLLTTYESDFAATHGRKVRDILTEHGPTVFGVRVSQASSAANRWDLDGHAGGMVSVGMGGALTGRGGNCIIIDDPVKGWEEAQSEAYLDKQWEWYEATLRTRLEPGGSVVLLMTRWSERDLVGRLVEKMAAEPTSDRWEVVRLPALAEPDMLPEGGFESVDPELWTDVLGRRLGEALWPQRWPVESFANVRTSPLVWDGLYQQRPSAPAGGLFQTQNWRYCTLEEATARLAGQTLVRAWDLASSDKKQGADPDWTAGVLMGTDDDGVCYVLDARRTREEAFGRDKFLRGTAIEDHQRWGNRVAIKIPQDPGAAGKAEAASMVRRVFSGFRVLKPEPVNGDKRTRATPFASQQGATNVRLVEAPWNTAFVNEFRVFPRGGHDDWVDAAADAFNYLAGLSRSRSRLVV